MAYVKGEISDMTAYRVLLIDSFLLQIYNMLSMPQVFEQSLLLFLFLLEKVMSVSSSGEAK